MAEAEHPGQSLTAQLASAMDALDITVAAPELKQKAVMLVTDLLGTALAGSRQREVQPVYSVVRDWGGKAEATVWGYGDTLPMVSAALVNGTFAHALELDDTHRATYCHVGASVIPAALAVGEAVHATGRQFLKAVIAGYETCLRIALSISPEHRLVGFHPTATVGCFGAAMAASVLLRLNKKQMVHALGLAGTQAAGFYQFQYDGASSKRFHPGKAAQNGILAAQLAQRDFTGSPEILEGRYGFCRVMSPKFEPQHITEDLGRRWRILEMGIKPYSACRFCHAPIDAAYMLRSHPSWNLSQLKTLELECGGQLYDQTGGNAPVTPLNAQLSTPNAIALALIVGGNTPGDVEAHFNEPDVMELTRRIQLTVNKSWPYPTRQVTLRATMQDGDTLAFFVELPSGEPEKPLSADAFMGKFSGLCRGTLKQNQILMLFDAANGLETSPDVAKLVPLLLSR